MPDSNKNQKPVKVLLIIGTRPEGIKLAPVIKELKESTGRFTCNICSTGQHREMLEQVFSFFEIKPDFDLGLMSENQSLEEISTRVLGSLGSIFDISKPDIILVQGDTSTAFLSALFAFYRKIAVGHVEAGLRTKDKYNPFPEEINRQLLSRVADLHFAPTSNAVKNLLNENIDRSSIFLTGNTVVDAIKWAVEKIKKRKMAIMKKEPFNRLKENKKMILVTMHRRESFGKEIEEICLALKEVAENHDDVQILYPVHLNPNVRKPVFEILGSTANIILCDPADYESFIWMMHESYFIITDSGGVQEEAPTVKKPVLVIRKKTERKESVEMGISKLIGTDRGNIIREASSLLDDEKKYSRMISEINPYGDGKASEKIADAIYNRFRLLF